MIAIQRSLLGLLGVCALTAHLSAAAGSFATAASPDTVAPVLTTPAAQSITGSSAIINWSSNKVADSRVYFGTADPLIDVAGDIEFSATHSVKLTKLLPNTRYSYQVVSVDPTGNRTTGAVQTFTTGTNALTSQTISFGTIPSVGVGQTGMVSATATSGLDVALSSSTTSVCSVAANGQPNQANVTGVTTGICGIAANQAGDTTYAAAAETVQYINIRATANPPSAPTITSLVAGPGRVVINFTQPSSNGGSAIVSYTATCTATGKATRTATGSGTPLVVNGLVGGTGYSCTLTASNGSYNSAASAAATVTPKKALDLSPIIMLLLDD